MHRPQPPSFSVRPSHRNVNPSAYDLARPSQPPTQQVTPVQNTGKTVLGNKSTSGFSMKSSDTSAEDFY